jgi:hypothetical protein
MFPVSTLFRLSQKCPKTSKKNISLIISTHLLNTSTEFELLSPAIFLISIINWLLS